MSANKDAVIEKIKKLLRMKRGGTPGEIENALAAAAELARKHSIDLASVDPDEDGEKEKLTHLQELMKTRLPLEAKLAGGVITAFFNVAVIVQRVRGICRGRLQQRWVVNLVGTEWDCKIAKYVFAFLQRVFRSTWSGRENRRLRNREAFLHGVYIGLVVRLEEEAEKQCANESAVLVIQRGVALREAYIAKAFPNLKKQNFKVDKLPQAAANAGCRAGKQINIRPAVNSAPMPARAALPAPSRQLALL